MKRSHSLVCVSVLAAAVVAGCSDDPTAPGAMLPNGGTSGAGTTGGSSGSGGSSAEGGTTSGGTGGTESAAGTGGTAEGGSTGAAGGSGGSDTGGGGAAAGGGGGSGGVAAGGDGSGGVAAGGGGTGGTAPGVVAAEMLIDSIIVQPETSNPTPQPSGGTGGGGAGGSGGTAGDTGGGGTGGDTGGGGTGGGGAGGTGGDTGGGAGGSAGAPTAPTGILYSYLFETALEGLVLHPEGSTPNIGLGGGMEKLSAKSTLAFFAGDGFPRPGSAKLTIPFTAKDEQLDVARGFNPLEDLRGYEITAKVKLTTVGQIGPCLGAWIWVTEGQGTYAFARGEIVALEKDVWKDVVINIDAPASRETNTLPLDPTKVNQFGIMIVSRNCP